MYALGANGGIALAKGAAAWHTGSGAMLAEAIHSCADCANQVLLLVGLKRAKRPCNEEHPLGYGKAVYFWSFIVALMLFSMGGIFSIYEGIHKILHPEMPKSPWIAVAVLAVSIVLEMVSLKGALVEVRKVQGKRSFLNWFRTSRQSELIVVTGEDIAALIGNPFLVSFPRFIYRRRTKTGCRRSRADGLGDHPRGDAVVIHPEFLALSLDSGKIGL